ncbi:hypothetical protein PHYSODRAFT_304805 [Phytophthora sojae]|uniref:Uncharacterized protein n=1 Tax=Phytophthora sojae (strain P6497) TaxID=1094619 RepID=G4ZZT6_PHYSP|nr:hypothetical protein PHYSODRAFT_304805 [Phytophthora sojae]EGZ11233.1 hypothetical protein PHYSODRAFT_304805 [Phytophthora sojae]|eukprot:XP_009533978.1 hypothetical protein PHYSODRAFT_304805 [Phytophthora sojae]
MERGQAILLAKYGRQTIEQHDIFSTAKDAKDFLKAYAFYQNVDSSAGIVRPQGLGMHLSESACDWHLNQSTKHKNNFCPEKAWFVSDLFLEHSPGCDSIGKCLTKVLMEMPGFQSAMVPGLSTSRKRVAESVKLVDNVNVDHRSAMLYKAIALAKKKLAAVTDDTYDKLPSFLRSFDVQPGNYLVGTCPLGILEMRNGYVSSEAEIPDIVNAISF